MVERLSEEKERRVFFSWQSDTPAKQNRTIIEAALARATAVVGAAWAPSDRPTTKIETAASDVVGARQITDVIFERIRSTDAFVADVSLVVRRGRRLMPNPNVLVETGYALHALGEARIVLVANTALGPIESLPFDIRSRLTLSYAMRSTDQPASAREALTAKLAKILGRILSLPRTTQDVRLDVGVFDLIALDSAEREGGDRETMFIVTVRNFSDYPLRLVNVAYEYDGKTSGFVFSEHQLLFATPIPARDSRQFTIPVGVMRSHKVGRVVATDSLGRSFYSEVGAVEKALRETAD